MLDYCSSEIGSCIPNVPYNYFVIYLYFIAYCRFEKAYFTYFSQENNK